MKNEETYTMKEAKRDFKQYSLALDLKEDWMALKLRDEIYPDFFDLYTMSKKEDKKFLRSKLVELFPGPFKHGGLK